MVSSKVLYADAKMNKAGWLTASAAMVGIVGIGFGLWWADAVAAALISLDITHVGFSNLRRAVVDLMDQTPTTIDQDNVDPLRDKLTSMLQDLDWVREVEVRLRDGGKFTSGKPLWCPPTRQTLRLTSRMPLSRIAASTGGSVTWR
jgi:divalent metal cation (Fe/Co/Zn/Cd) transporter